MLMDILGIMVGFCGIMLIFSLLVTAMVHGLQAMLNMRVKNMRHVVARFFDQFDSIETQQVLDKIDKRIPDNINPLIIPTRGRWLSRPIKLSVISRQELDGIIDDVATDSEQVCATIKSDLESGFDYLEEVMAQRFKQWMHQLSIVIAFLLAFVFQLNMFELITQLNQDSVLRLQTNQWATAQVEKGGSELTSSGQDLSTRLNAMDFQVFQHGWAYYLGSNMAEKVRSAMGWPTPETQNSLQSVTFGQVLFHWFGVICSAIFISLGAPFWFNSLKNVLNLRDKLAVAHSTQSAQPVTPALRAVTDNADKRSEHG